MGVVRKTIRGAAEMLLTIGLIGLLLCVHQLYWTNIEARADMNAALEQLDKKWAKEDASPADEDAEPPPALPAEETGGGAQDVGVDGHRDGTVVAGSKSVRGEVLAALYIPRLGSDYRKPIIEGSSLKSLAQGVGHYTYPPYVGPGQVGNFGLAGHRNGHGEPFRYLNKLRTGDKVVVETGGKWFTYTILRGKYITKPSNGSVLTAQPPQLNVGPGEHLITLTTCDPEFTSRNRMVYWGKLTETDDKREGFKPAALSG